MAILYKQVIVKHSKQISYTLKKQIYYLNNNNDENKMYVRY